MVSIKPLEQDTVWRAVASRTDTGRARHVAGEWEINKQR